MTRREFTAALAALPAEDAPWTGGTALLPEGGTWQRSNLSASLKSKGAFEVKLGPANAPLARESWHIASTGDRFEWRIRREFLRDVRVQADRFPVLGKAP